MSSQRWAYILFNLLIKHNKTMNRKRTISPYQSRIRRRTLTLMACVVVFFVSLGTMTALSNANIVNTGESTAMAVMRTYELKSDSIQILNDSIFNVKSKLYKEVEDYIKKCSPKSKMSGKLIADLCLEYDFDIPLLLSQAQTETNFGIGNSRNSVFGIYNKRYAHPNDAVLDYIKLMQKSYIKNRSVEKALNMGMNVEGSSKYRYAEDPNYCTKIKKVRSSIIRGTEIKFLHNYYRELVLRLERI